MTRDYDLMRDILECINERDSVSLATLGDLGKKESLVAEMRFIQAEGLTKSSFKFSEDGRYLGGVANGLTTEGLEFLHLIQNQDVWDLVLKVLSQANVDIPYPLLKEVCEEIVKRYVVSFIPEIRH